jgi:hypothetical protein
MKVKVSTLVRVASVLVHNLDETKFIGAIRSFVGRNTDKETLGSTARETKDGQAFTVSLTQRTRKVDGVDARAIHWLAACSELASLGLMDEGAGLSGCLPKPASDVSAWLAKFKADTSSKSDPEK